MKLEKNNRNRCFIVLYFDKDGLVDRYMKNMLRSIREDAAYVLMRSLMTKGKAYLIWAFTNCQSTTSLF